MTIPNYLNPKSPQKQGRMQEKKAAQTINSGSLWFSKGDLTVKETDEEYLIDVKKVVLQKGYTISLKEVDKLYKQSGKKTPVLLVYLGPYVIKGIIQRV